MPTDPRLRDDIPSGHKAPPHLIHRFLLFSIMILIISSEPQPREQQPHPRRRKPRWRSPGTQDGHAACLLDSREQSAALCDGDAAYSHPNVARQVRTLVQLRPRPSSPPPPSTTTTALPRSRTSSGSRAARGRTGVVGFLCAAGGLGSYMSIMSLANSLMLDFRTVIVPRFVYATGDAFCLVDSKLVDPDGQARRVAELAPRPRAAERSAQGGLISSVELARKRYWQRRPGQRLQAGSYNEPGCP